MPARIWRTPIDLGKAKRYKPEIQIIESQCKGCGFCMQFCPRNVLEKSAEINPRGAHPPKVVDERQCILCGFCTSVCPDFAIFVVEKQCKDGC